MRVSRAKAAQIRERLFASRKIYAVVGAIRMHMKPNRVARHLTPSPTLPTLRVRSGRFNKLARTTKIPMSSQTVLSRAPQQTLFPEQSIGHGLLGDGGLAMCQ